MLKKRKNNYCTNLKKNKIFIFLTCFCLIIQFFYCAFASAAYSFFIEFNNASGIQVGTLIRMRGVNIGFIESVRLKPNCVLAVAKISSNKILIPASSLIETNQTGLLNEPVVDIITPSLPSQDTYSQDPLSQSCNGSMFICHRMYMVGHRGLNYDDLIRSATRISQRFDDPRFFNIFYVFLQHTIDATDLLIKMCRSIVDTSAIVSLRVYDFSSDDFQ